MLTLDNKTFDALLESNGLYVIDFAAKHCGPCRTMLPVIDSLASEYANRVKFFTVDVDDEPELAQRYFVRSMPTFVVLRDGREVGRIIGARPRAFVAGVLDRALAGDVAITAP